ncbi:MAG: hypothetical protein VX498_15390 [Myxococcota bacterium]|nr:hypothetical protein [Myxococcota bacterium]
MSPSLSEACSSWNPPAILVRLLPVALGGLFIGGCAVDITDPGAAGTDFGNDDQVTDEAGDSGDGSGDDDNSEPAPVTFTPLEGNWVVTSSALSLDECGLEEWVDRGEPGSIMYLENTGDLTFEMTFGPESADISGGGEVVLCTINDDTLDFQCKTVDDLRDLDEEFNLDAVVPIGITSSGTFFAENAGTVASRVDLGCEGNDCYLVELLLGTSFPCTMIMDIEVEPSP